MNTPFGNSITTAEHAIAMMFATARQIPAADASTRAGKWEKSKFMGVEITGKTLGLIGAGNIGSVVAARAIGLKMKVIAYDPFLSAERAQALGIERIEEVDDLLARADFVTLHVPETPRTVGMIGEAAIARMRQGSYLLNLSRGQVVVVPALQAALASGHLGGAALDVYPSEPKPQVAEFDVGFADLPNVILTPHVGGNTEEAQKNIGLEVAQSLSEFIDRGSTEWAVQFPQVNPPDVPGAHRILHIHQNVPGVLAAVNNIVSEVGANIEAQQLATSRDIGYLVMDVNRELSDEVHSRISALPMNVRTRILY
jgi:D-3-phosphoglycerate dehydrogenase